PHTETTESTSWVWTAQGTTHTRGNDHVTMTKTAYTEVATDSSVSPVGQVPAASCTNDQLGSSPAIGTAAALNSALNQVSDSQA
ncbi:hypothetical protein, partial [Escherichia coli]|uniref:hypothetical protein n=1 Tax=Escherichia coli TaxID=562 RepID=UPI00131A0A82